MVNAGRSRWRREVGWQFLSATTREAFVPFDSAIHGGSASERDAWNELKVLIWNYFPVTGKYQWERAWWIWATSTHDFTDGITAASIKLQYAAQDVPLQVQERLRGVDQLRLLCLLQEHVSSGGNRSNFAAFLEGKDDLDLRGASGKQAQVVMESRVASFLRGFSDGRVRHRVEQCPGVDSRSLQGREKGGAL